MKPKPLDTMGKVNLIVFPPLIVLVAVLSAGSAIDTVRRGLAGEAVDWLMASSGLLVGAALALLGWQVVRPRKDGADWALQGVVLLLGISNLARMVRDGGLAALATFAGVGYVAMVLFCGLAMYQWAVNRLREDRAPE